MNEMKPRVIRVEDASGTGECGHCGKTGLRWVVIMSDGAVIGASCAKRAMGFEIEPAAVVKLTGFELIAEFISASSGSHNGLWFDGTTYADTVKGRIVRMTTRRDQIASVWIKKGLI